LREHTKGWKMIVKWMIEKQANILSVQIEEFVHLYDKGCAQLRGKRSEKSLLQYEVECEI